MADYFIKFSFCVELPSKAAQTYALDLPAQAKEYFSDQNEPPPPDFPATLLDALGEWEDVYWSFTTEKSGEGNGIWVHAEYGDGGTDVACLFVQHLLQRFNLTSHVAFQWSRDCGKPRTDAYGGGAAFITAQEIRIMSTSQWLDEQHA